MVYVTEALLYVSFSVLLGGLIIGLIPEDKRPHIVVPQSVLIAACAAIPILSFFPVHVAIKFFANAFEDTYWSLIDDVLININVGNAWLWSIGLTIPLMMLFLVKAFKDDKTTPYVAIVFTLAQIVAFGWASHSSGMYRWEGFLLHTAHFLAVVVWIGLLFVTGRFAKDNRNWEAFLKWFSPLSMICVGVTILAGFMMMNLLEPNYVHSWVFSYGQALLIKHLLIIPLLIFAFFNGFLIKNKLKRNPQFNPVSWLRAESMIAFLIFSITAIMGQQTPSHDIAEALEFGLQPSQLFSLFFRGEVSPDTLLQLSLSPLSVTFATVSVLSLILMLYFFYKKERYVPVLMMSLLFVITTYLSLMLGIK
ncbi:MULTISPECIES: CopD family protein [unclassified Paenibacillus]|uniref:copper resistance D family protein n=1 Tax=unclassified Paenibacillus TaxID=185978 RepID=UPI001AE5C2F7|nr:MULTISPECIES: CopD family protein [unclassified Paenibacillus]MBP1156478.1 putative copper resistance protein D [Paenibacillus sp. PvP091]MBP1168136.1 putative copper resistance protein D [Paenibacillus sp. PvR098]MBP2439164.1 putative copper resistance protein D [Paenibacillus sp. PvP052]